MAEPTSCCAGPGGYCARVDALFNLALASTSPTSPGATRPTAASPVIASSSVLRPRRWSPRSASTRSAAPIRSMSSAGPPTPLTRSAGRRGTKPAAPFGNAVRGRATGHAKTLKHARYALWVNPENLTSRQQAKLAWVAKTDPRLHRAYLLKEGLRLVFQLPAEEAPDALQVWIGWARRCRIPAFVELQRRILKHKASILAAIEHGLSNGRIESGQHQDPAHHPDRVRIPFARSTHRPGHAQPRRP